MPPYRPSDTVGAAWVTWGLNKACIDPRQNVTNLWAIAVLKIALVCSMCFFHILFGKAMHVGFRIQKTAIGLLLTGLLFISRFAEISQKREPNASGPIIMFHEATLVHLIESSKPAARAKGIRLIVLLDVP